MSRSRELGLLAAVLLAAAALRAYRLDAMGGAPSTLRVSLLAGLALVLATFLLARRLLGARGALLAGALSAASPYLVSRSQVGPAENLLALLCLAALHLLIATLETPAPVRFAALGCLVGLALAVSTAAAPLAAALAVVAVTDRRREAVLPRLRLAALAGGATLLAASLGLHFMGLRSSWLAPPSPATGIEALHPLVAGVAPDPGAWPLHGALLVTLVPAVLGLYGAAAACLRSGPAERLLAASTLALVAWIDLVVPEPGARPWAATTPAFLVLAAGVTLRAAARLARTPLDLALGPLALAATAWLALALSSRDTDREVAAWAGRRLPAGARLLSQGVRLAPPEPGIQVDVAESLLAVGRRLRSATYDHLLLDLGRSAEDLARFPRLRETSLEVLLDARLEPTAWLEPGGWPERGSRYALFDRAGCPPWAVVEELTVAPPSFAIAGDGGTTPELVWVRGPGSRAEARIDMAIAEGEQATIELRAAGDPSQLEPGGRMRFRLESGAAWLDGEARPSELDRFELARAAPGPELPLRIVYTGDPGGRLYATAPVARRSLLRQALAPPILARRIEELAIVGRAGLD